MSTLGFADGVVALVVVGPPLGIFAVSAAAGAPSAAFVSAGGYHHHIGMNTWNSAGAPPPPPESIGLRYFVTRLPNLAELGRVLDRVHAAGISTEEQDEGVLVRDPSQIGMILTAPSTLAELT